MGFDSDGKMWQIDGAFCKKLAKSGWKVVKNIFALPSTIGLLKIAKELDVGASWALAAQLSVGFIRHHSVQSVLVPMFGNQKWVCCCLLPSSPDLNISKTRLVVPCSQMLRERSSEIMARTQQEHMTQVQSFTWQLKLLRIPARFF